MAAASDDKMRNLVFASHALLAALMVAWRALEATPRTSARLGNEFVTTFVGRALTFASVWAAVLALGAVLYLSLTGERWRDWRISTLLVTLALSLSMRAKVDAFDLVYVGVTAMLATYWFEMRRRMRTG